MGWLSVSLPQVDVLQPKIWALPTAGPCLKVFPALAVTRTVICSLDPVQPTEVDPEPWATPDPAFWVTVTLTNAALVTLQVTFSHPAKQQRRTNTGAGATPQGAVKNCPGSQSHRRNDRAQQIPAG